MSVIFRIDGNPVKITQYFFVNLAESVMNRIYKYALLVHENENVLFLFTELESLYLHFEEFYDKHISVWIQELKQPIVL